MGAADTAIESIMPTEIPPFSISLLTESTPEIYRKRPDISDVSLRSPSWRRIVELNVEK